MREEVYIEAKMDLNQVYNELNKLESTIKSKDVNLKIKATVDREGLNATRELDTTVNKLSTSISKLNITNTGGAQSNIKFRQSLDSVVEGVKSSTSAYDSLLDKKVELINRISALKEALKSSSGAIRDSFVKELHLAQLELKNTNSEIRAFEKQSITSVTGAQTVRDKFSKSLQIGFFSTFGAFSLAGMVKKGIDATVKFLKDGISEAISFESAFAGVRKTIEATEFEFQTFNRELKQMATEIPRTYQELAKIAELGGQMGVPLEELGAFTKAIAALEVSTDIGLEDAALQFSRLATIMNISMEDIGRIGSAVVDLGNNFAATESEITNFMMRIAGTGNVVNMTAGDIAGISTAFTAVGIAAEKGGTAVNKMLLGIETAVVQGGKELETYAKLAGRTAEDFVRGWRENSGGIFADVVEGLGEAGSEANDYLVELLGKGTRIKEVFLNMAGASDVLKDAVQKGNTAYAQNNALWEEAAKRYGTTESQLQILDNKMAQNKEKLGNELLPVYVRWKELLVDVVGWLAKAASAVEALGKAVRRSKDGLISMLEIGIDASKRTNMIEFIPDGFVSRVEDARAKLDGFDTSLTGAEAALKKVNLAMDETDERVAELTASYSNGKISLDEYTEGLVEQFKAKAQLEEQQKVAIERLSSEQFFLDKIKDSQKELTKAQDDFAKKEVDLSKNRAELKLVEERLEAIDKKYSELDKQRPEIKLKIDDLNQQKTDIEDKINGINKAMNKGEEATQKYTKALKGYSTLNEVAKWSDGARQAIEDLNNNPLNTKEDRDEAAKSVVALQRYTEEMIRAYKAKNLFLLSQFSAANEIAKSGTKLEKAALFVAEKLGNGRVGLKKEVLQNDKLVKDLQALAKEDIGSLFDKTPSGGGAGDLREEYNLQAMTISELNDEMSRLNEIINTSVVGSERYNTALQDRTTLQERLNEIIADQQELLKDEVKGAKSSEDAKKAQIKLIELEAMRRIEAVRSLGDTEEIVAKEIVAISERAAAEKKRIEGDYIGLAVDGAKEVIKKYKELRDEGVKAFKDITKEIETNAKEIDKLTTSIDKLRAKMAELDDKKVKDLGSRYVEVKNQIEELTKKIAEANEATVEFDDVGRDLKKDWKDLKDEIDKITKEIKKYGDEIDKIKKKMEDLNKSETDKLSERYAKIADEITKLKKELDPYLKYDILTDADAKKKLDIEEKYNKLLGEQQKIVGALTDEQLDRAKAMIGETETDKIIREAQEKRDTYKQEIKDFEDKIKEESTVLELHEKEKAEMLKKYSWLEVDTDKAKYQELIKNIKEYTTERDKLLKEQSHLEMLLSAREIQDAINESKKTETQLILDKYNLELATMNSELDEFNKLQQEKLKSLVWFYMEAVDLQKKYKAMGIDFTPEQKEQIAGAAQQVANIPKGQQDYVREYVQNTNKLLKEQEDAVMQLEIVAKSLAKISDAQLKGMGEQALREMFAKIAELQLVTSGAHMRTSSTTSNSIVNNQSFNLASNLDAQAIARQIRLAIKL